MRIELQFQVKKNEFPVDYRSVFLSFLKSCLFKCNEGKYMEQYFEPSKAKEYSFAVFFSKAKFLPETIELETNKVKMIFSTSDITTGFIFYSCFLENKYHVFPLKNGNEMQLVGVQKLKEHNVTSNKVLFQIASPLCIRKHNKEENKDYYYSFVHEEFQKEFLNVVERQLKNAGFPEQYLEGLAIEPVHCKKVIVKHYGYKIECTLGKIAMEGNPAVLQYLLRAGIGSRKSMGFGLLELLAQE